jgi:hypothetical protein
MSAWLLLLLLLFIPFVHCDLDLVAFEAFDFSGKLPSANTNSTSSFGFAECVDKTLTNRNSIFRPHRGWQRVDTNDLPAATNAATPTLFVKRIVLRRLIFLLLVI